MVFAMSTGNPGHGKEKQSKHIIFGPRTLRRTWGTRPVPWGSVTTKTIESDHR
jgi:hypothetical protein